MISHAGTACGLVVLLQATTCLISALGIHNSLLSPSTPPSPHSLFPPDMDFGSLSSMFDPPPKRFPTTALAQSAILKDYGNNHRRCGNFSGAVNYYTVAAKLARLQTSSNEAQLCAACDLNAAHCLWKLGEFKEGLKRCTLCMLWQADDITDGIKSRCLVRRARCLVGLSKIDMALTDLQMASNLQPNNSAIARELDQLKSSHASTVDDTMNTTAIELDPIEVYLKALDVTEDISTVIDAITLEPSDVAVQRCLNIARSQFDQDQQSLNKQSKSPFTQFGPFGTSAGSNVLSDIVAFLPHVQEVVLGSSTGGRSFESLSSLLADTKRLSKHSSGWTKRLLKKLNDDKFVQDVTTLLKRLDSGTVKTLLQVANIDVAEGTPQKISKFLQGMNKRSFQIIAAVIRTGLAIQSIRQFTISNRSQLFWCVVAWWAYMSFTVPLVPRARMT